MAGRHQRSGTVDARPTVIPKPEARCVTGRSPLYYQYHDGGLEAMVQGYRNALLKADDYTNLCQCDSLDGIKTYLRTNTAYEGFLDDCATLTPKIIQEKAREKLVRDFNELREWADSPLSDFLDMITYDYMIQNILKLIQGARANRDGLQVLRSLHPLGKFEGMGAVMADCDSVADLYATMTEIELPIVSFFSLNASLVKDDASQIQQVRAMFKKSYIEAFFDLCQEIGGTTLEVMRDILEFEADQQTLTVAKNLLGSPEISPGYERLRLFPNVGTLVDYHSRDMSSTGASGGDKGIAECNDNEQLRAVFSDDKKGLRMWERVLGGSGAGFGQDQGASQVSGMEAELKKIAISLWKDALNRQFHYGVFYAWVKLVEHEISNINWICECIEGRHTSRIRDFIPIFTSEEQ
eukprot:TRINITY_DN71490_c0_g1_i1.p1 TRINITY_DN71490_c0_g1~~TRINITY_DN71490_c0_g1_i1.p1  ORF type:complete len:409 (+),score=172.90 TRINITY_DN71490_c0_g1_i1:120-1346(+)